MNSLLCIFLVCCVWITAAHGYCYSSTCSFPSLTDYISSYCDASAKFLQCLDEKILNNPDCSYEVKRQFNTAKNTVKEARSLSRCSALDSPSQAQCDPLESCHTPDTSELKSFCESSQYYINCLYKEVVSNGRCSDSTKTRYRDIMSFTKTERTSRGCSAAVGLTSSLTLCAASLIYVIFSKQAT